ncbi:protein of unknown function [Bartonella clarridgeiae 73]|uniref:Uncharacterized protein n=1 Tax=Bartonella clarridgeiae (strain CCUG 45776 / CIP 104772 / 73) TaxID=696125 RepID=E6YGE6_BARC7|nr:protein of unknown function [Bartonella clarridgeiae 73]
MPKRGFEPPRLVAQIPEICASTNSAIWTMKFILSLLNTFCQCNYKNYQLMETVKNFTDEINICTKRIIDSKVVTNILFKQYNNQI